MRILLDCDGVLSDFITPALRVVELLTGKQYAHDDVTDWDLDVLVPEGQRETFWEACSAPGFARNMQPYPGAVAAVEALRTRHNVFVVTAYMHSSKTWVHDRDAWLHHYFGFMQRDIVHTKAKHLIAGDVFVDDKPSNVREWQMEHTDGIGLIFDRPHNRDAVGTRVFDWIDVCEHILKARGARIR